MIGAELVCNVSPDDGNGGGSYFGPVASSAAGSNRVSLPENSQGGGGEAFLVMNGTGAGQIHAIVAYNATRHPVGCYSWRRLLGTDAELSGKESLHRQSLG